MESEAYRKCTVENKMQMNTKQNTNNANELKASTLKCHNLVIFSQNATNGVLAKYTEYIHVQQANISVKRHSLMLIFKFF